MAVLLSRCPGDGDDFVFSLFSTLLYLKLFLLSESRSTSKESSEGMLLMEEMLQSE